MGASVPQQGWLWPPQPGQRPATQAAPETPPSPEVPLLQAPPSATQWPSKQQLFPSHVLPAQQARPGLPQATHAEYSVYPAQTSPLVEQL